MNSIVIGFTGGTGSGKTTLAQRLNEVFKNNSVIIKQDSYYKDFPDKSFEERVQINYDHPDSFDMERFTDDVRRLKAGETIECPVYNYAEYKRDKETVTVEPKRIIILEGLFLFENPALSDLIDIKVFVDTDADVRILRRIIRDVKERRQESRFRRFAVPYDRQTDARKVYRAGKETRRYHRAGRRI